MVSRFIEIKPVSRAFVEAMMTAENEQEAYFARAQALAGAPNWKQRPPSQSVAWRGIVWPKLMNRKTCREKMKHMLRLDGAGARVFLACLHERMNELEP